MMKIFQKYMLHINNLILFFKILFWVIAEFYDKKIEFFGYVTWRFWVLDRCAHDTGVYDHHVTIENLKTVILGQIRKEFKMSSNKPVVENFEKIDNQCMDQCMVELGLSDWKSDFESSRSLLNVNLKILIFGSDKDWSSSVGSTTMLQKYFNPLWLTFLKMN